MKRAIILVIFSMGVYHNSAQSFGDSETCNVNAQDNGSNYAREYRTSPREATFKYIYTDKNSDNWYCTGTLINRHTNNADVGFYFLTARHCSHDIDYDKVHTLCFNYQSPDGANGNTANTNEGHNPVQSGRDFNNPYNYELNGYEYLHKTKLRLVNEFAWGDFTLLEILTPVPPHFNISYAGWNPSLFHNGITIGTPPSFFDPYVGIHHPKGDIKKVSTVSYIHWNENPVATDCYTITTIINILFGWIWQHQVSTQVICNWMDNPYFTVFGWQHGITQPGSSGSGMFNRNNKQIGVLSFGPENLCNLGNFDNYGKLRTQYSKQSIRGILNPDNDLDVDLVGLESRKIACYDNLELPGAPGVSGHFFPANHYQPDNTIELQAANNITMTQPIRVYNGAEYHFKAGNEIDIVSDFEAEQGSEVIMEIQSCASNRESSITQQLTDKLNAIKIPKYKKFEITDISIGQLYSSKQNAELAMQIFPNPSNGQFKLKFALSGNYNIVVSDALGARIYNTNIVNDSEKEIILNKTQGLYFVTATDRNGNKITGKVSMIIN